MKSQPVFDIEISLEEGKKVYFASDQHFGGADVADSRRREKIFLDWLRNIRKDAQVLFLLGDLFDFWHEWKFVVPKGYVRVLAELADMVESGIPVYFFVGNHDLWMGDYFEKELGIPVFHDKKWVKINDTAFLIAHGDGLGPGDKGYKRMKKLFTNPVAQWCFRWLHPDIAMGVANYFSQKNKMISGQEDMKFLGVEKEFLMLYAEKKSSEFEVDYLIFGHRHLPMEYTLKSGAVYVNLGDWIRYFSYGEFDGTFHLKYNHTAK